MADENTNGTLTAHVPTVLLDHLAEAPDQLVRSLEATVVFADVSGFTKLSERLARSGREGAERLLVTINSCFSALLADAYQDGASLIKFGGDALLLWFEGDGHAARGCDAAVAMRRTLRSLVADRSGGERLSLRMSVGVHSGRFDTFLVGSSHREYLICGPAASTVVEMEAAAQTGQILVSPETARLLPARCTGAAEGPGVLLTRAPPCDHHPKRRLPRASVDVVASCLSTELRAHLLAAPAAPEHRIATVTFLQFGGLDEVIARSGVDEAAAQLDELVRIVQEAADRYEVCFLGSDIAADGGKLLLSGAAPRAVGDDEERMLLAMRQVIDAAPRLPVRIGVNRGNTFASDVGPFYRRTYAVMGDTVNLAARLCAKAPWGSIYATPGVLDRSRTRFECTTLEPFLVKGKSRPVQALSVGAAAGAAGPAAAHGRVPLIGRRMEMIVLMQAVASAKRGRGGMIELTGEAGSGKSRLLTEARRMAEGFAVVHTVCEAYTQTVPYAAWREPMRQLLGVTRDDPDELVVARLRARVQRTTPELLPWLPLLAIVAGTELPLTREIRELSEEFRAAKLHEAVLAFLARALNVPTLVEIEHAHTMDEASASLLHAFSTVLRRSAWVVLVTRRDQPSGFEATDLTAHRIEIQPLPARLSLALAESTAEANVLPPHVLELAVQRSEGSPEFLLDLLAAAAGGSGVLPDSVEAAASARIDALAPADRALVRRAALLGLSFEPQRVLDVLGEGAPVPDELTWKRLDGIFAAEQNGQLRFRRPALREGAYDGLPFDLRRKLHAAVGEALELELGTAAAADPAVLSLHFSRAGAHAKAWKYALMGADRASARFANADAVVLYRRALEAGRANGVPAEELSRVWESLGESLRLSGEPRAALQALTAARRLSSGDPLAQARLSYKQADIAERHERLTAAVRSLLQGLRLLESVDADQARIWRARLIADLGSIRMRQGRVKDAIKLSRQAIAEAESIGEARALARACYLLDWALVESGQGAEAIHSERALEIYARLEDPEWEARVVNNLGTFAYADGRWDEAVELYSRARELSMRAGNMDVAANGDCNIGEILSDQGRLEEAGVYLERARRVWSSIGQLQGVAFVTLLLGRRAIRAGHYAEGLPLLQQAAADLERMRLRYYVGLANACVGEAEALGGSAERALQIADQLLASDDRNGALIRRVRAIALARLGRTAAAVDDLELSIAAAGDHGTDYDVAAALDLLDALGVLVDGIDERDRIISKLRIEVLPRVELGGGRPGHMPGAELAA